MLAMVKRKKKQKQQEIDKTENILWKGCTIKDVWNNDQKSTGRSVNGTAWNSLHSGNLTTSS